MRQFDQSANGTEVTLHKGETIELHLPENRTTGFRWHLQNRGEPVWAVEAEDFKPGGTSVGAGGTHSWRIKALATGTAQIELTHARAWEAKSSSAQTFALKIRAED
jgi:inhibitor of cysteine peptidase